MMTAAPGLIQRWLLAARPKTLWAAVGPVMIGTAMASTTEAGIHAPSAWLALAGAILLQIGTNFCNDYADFIKGADTERRTGPARAVASGWITPRQMLVATILVFALAALVCGALVLRAGWPLILLGVVSIVAGVLYTAGPYPLAYVGLGDLFVLVFFGPVATAGTYFVQTLEFTWLAAAAGIGPGFLSVAILTVNNLRDRVSDTEAGKRTLAVRFGAGFARIEYILCLLVAAVMPLVLVSWAGPQHRNALAATLILFASWPVIRLVMTRSGRELNPGLGMTALLLLAYSLAFSIGWAMVRT
jgi:1,4-dihydroxy-2-naphthoate octaprenyltransferase